MYLAYALFCEGPSDYSYFEVLPADAEQAENHPTPKTCLDSALRTVRGARRSRGDSLLPGIAQRQSIDALKGSISFQEFEGSLQRALLDLGVLEGIGR